MKDIDDGVYGVSSWGVRGPTFLQELCVSPPEAHHLCETSLPGSGFSQCGWQTQEGLLSIFPLVSLGIIHPSAMKRALCPDEGQGKGQKFCGQLQDAGSWKVRVCVACFVEVFVESCFL